MREEIWYMREGREERGEMIYDRGDMREEERREERGGMRGEREEEVI